MKPRRCTTAANGECEGGYHGLRHEGPGIVRGLLLSGRDETYEMLPSRDTFVHFLNCRPRQCVSTNCYRPFRPHIGEFGRFVREWLIRNGYAPLRECISRLYASMSDEDLCHEYRSPLTFIKRLPPHRKIANDLTTFIFDITRPEHGEPCRFETRVDGIHTRLVLQGCCDQWTREVRSVLMRRLGIE